ncbi:hypothetical protein EDB80DRAFT_881487 [Ilyonectria destructans]|nr:hypothetical protein EDB80DRAFT_881487 [Ilyonectria destructans]
MISRFIFSAFVALGLLIGIISGAPLLGSRVTENSILGRTEYQLVYTVPTKRSSLWEFDVYSNGYDGTKGKEKPADGVQVDKVLDNFTIDTATKTLTVLSVWNKYDKTPKRLRLRQILHDCWKKTGLKPLELKVVQGKMIRNQEMQDALNFCRENLDLGNRDNFRVKPDAKGKECWDRLDKTVFSKIIKGAIKDFGPSKTLVQIELDNTFLGDNILYTFK